MCIYIYIRIYTYAYLCIHMHLVCWRALCSWDWFWPGGPVRCSASPVMSFHFVRVKRVRLRDEELQALPCTWHTSIRICIGVEVELISLPWVRFFHFVELCSWPSWMMSKKKEAPDVLRNDYSNSSTKSDLEVSEASPGLAEACPSIWQASVGCGGIVTSFSMELVAVGVPACCWRQSCGHWKVFQCSLLHGRSCIILAWNLRRVGIVDKKLH